MNHFYRNCYWGPKASMKKKECKHAVRWKKPLPGIYMIVLSSKKSDQLEIYELLQFSQPPLKKVDFYVMGVAQGRVEALELVRCMVDDCMQQTGSADVRAMLSGKLGAKDTD